MIISTSRMMIPREMFHIYICSGVWHCLGNLFWGASSTFRVLGLIVIKQNDGATHHWYCTWNCWNSYHLIPFHYWNYARWWETSWHAPATDYVADKAACDKVWYAVWRSYHWQWQKIGHQGYDNFDKQNDDPKGDVSHIHLLWGLTLPWEFILGGIEYF